MSGSGVGDRVATRRNDPDLEVANRQTWTVTGIGDDGSLTLRGRGRDRDGPGRVRHASTSSSPTPPPSTAPRARPSTPPTSLLGETTGAAAAYVAMTRGRDSNTAHLVAETVDDARQQWIEIFSRDRADLGPAHARRQAIEAIDRYGPAAVARSNATTPGPGVPAAHLTALRNRPLTSGCSQRLRERR